MRTGNLTTRKITKGIRRSTIANQSLVGTSGNDTLNSFKGKGKNTVRGKGGNDKLFAGQNDKLFGDAGDDILDARKGKRKNQLFGGQGNDKLYAKSLETLDGGQGADELWIANGAFPIGVSTIKNFEIGVDKIGISSLPGVTTFNDLTLTQQGGDTLISAKGQALGVLSGVTASNLSSNDFVGLQVSPPLSLPKLSISHSSVAEGNTGKVNVVFTVGLDVSSNAPITVDYATANGAAIASSDYVVVNGTLTFAPGETAKSVMVEVISDITIEADETFVVNLSNPTNAEITNGQATGTILDDDNTTTIRGIGNEASGGRINNTFVKYSFKLYTITPEGNFREDNNPDNYSGTFKGAIENFQAEIKDTSEVTDGHPTGTFPEFREVCVNGLTLDLKAALNFDPDRKLISIVYTLTSSELEAQGIIKLDLIIDQSVDPDNFKAIGDPVQAVNSIEYIIREDLLKRVNLIGVSSKTACDVNPENEPASGTVIDIPDREVEVPIP
jgi:hypothetical protein